MQKKKELNILTTVLLLILILSFQLEQVLIH